MGIIWIGVYLCLAILLLLSADYSDYDLISDKNQTLSRKISVRINKDLVIVILIIVFAIFCATRDIHSYDTQVYSSWYARIASNDFWTYDGEYLPVFELTSKIISIIAGNNFRVYSFILTTLNLYIVYLVTKKINNVGLYGFLLYLFYIGFYYNFCVLRQGLAFSFIFIGIEQLQKSKVRSYVFFALAALSHESAWIMFMIVLITEKIKLKENTCYAITAVSLINYISSFAGKLFSILAPIIYIYIPPKFQGKFALYFIQANEDGTVSIFYILYFLITLFLIYRLYHGKVNKYDYNNPNIGRILIINIIGLMILSFSSVYSIISRVADYMVLISLVVLLPITLKDYKKSTRDIIIFVLCLLAFIIQMRIFSRVVEIRFF